MNKFNVARGYVLSLNGMNVPKGAFYGRDGHGIWVCMKKELYPLETPTLELYRWNNGGWCLTIEQSATTAYIKACADKNNLWKIPVEYPRFKGLHTISAQMDKTITKKKSQSLKQGRKERRNIYEVPLDYAEKVLSRTF